jgi:hypothetical protein
MGMPPQLERALRVTKPKAKGSTKPIVETLPCFNINELLSAIPRRHDIIRRQSFSSPSHPPTIGLRLTCETIEVAHRNGSIQTFRLKWIRTYFGRHRPAIHCDKCQRPVIKLYNLHNDLACKFCRGAIYLSQKISPDNRSILKAHRLEQFMLLKTNAQQRSRERLLKRYGEEAMRPRSNYQLKSPRHWAR